VKIGVLGSSGGSAFAAFYDIVTAVRPGRYSFAAVSDRACGFEEVCRERAIPLIRAEGGDNHALSQAAAGFLTERLTPDIVLLYYLRLTTAVLYERYPTFNIHSSLLPSFRGFDPVGQAVKAGVRFFGATLHEVDETVDGGPIVAQIVMPLAPATPLERVAKYSFLHKVYCGLLLIDLIERDLLSLNGDRPRLAERADGTDRSNPALADVPLLDHFRALQRREGVEVLP
jgi:phosphoribosylglycinamide formyltransferase-1